MITGETVIRTGMSTDDDHPTHDLTDHHHRLETVAPRLIERWLAEAEEHANGPEGGPEERGAAAQARRAWEDGGRFTGDAARELADWASARVTDTAFNADRPGGDKAPGLSVADKEAVHRWLAEQRYLV